MKRIFEDEFMDWQADLIGLCLEATEGKEVSKIYAYCSNEKYVKSFNVFYESDGKIKTTDQLGIPDHIISQLLDVGTSDVCKLDSLCEKYSKPAPTEMKMYYDVKTRKFEAKYKYEEVCSAKFDKCANNIFDDWFEEISGHNIFEE